MELKAGGSISPARAQQDMVSMFVFATRSATMTRISKLALIAAVTAVIATPAFAQSFDPENGTGNVLSFSTPSAVQNVKVAARHTSQDKIAARRNGLHSFAMVPGAAAGSNANDPAQTGGGSTGYNQMLLQY
jgi:hypothetical protein